MDTLKGTGLKIMEDNYIKSHTNHKIFSKTEIQVCMYIYVYVYASKYICSVSLVYHSDVLNCDATQDLLYVYIYANEVIFLQCITYLS